MMGEQVRRRPDQEPIRRTYEIVNTPFWRGAIPLLRQHNTEVLENQALDIARQSRHIRMVDFRRANGFAKEVHGDEFRDLTRTPYLNHLYKVFILSTMIAGSNNITNEGAQIALLHDTVENKGVSWGDLKKLSGGDDVPRGVYALSHREKGKDIFPEDHERTVYLGGIARMQLIEPHTNVGFVKVADQAHNGSDPATEAEIIDPTPGRIQLWKDKSNDKIPQMRKLAAMFRSMGNNQLANFLEDAANFTEARQDPDFDGFPNNVLRRQR